MPETLAPVLGDTVLELVDIHHTLMMAILTPDSIIIIDKQTLLPITVYTRPPKSLDQQGTNQYLKTKSINIDAVNLQKLEVVNLFLITNKDYLIIYQLHIPQNASIYELHKESTGEMIQKQLPITTGTANSGSIFQYLKEMTKSVMGNNLITLENIENFNNQSQYQELQLINNCKISVFKILKISNGINNNNVWVKSNSHNIFINNLNLFQIINIKNLKEVTFNVLDFEWYTGGDLINSWYNSYKKSFIFINEYDELWYLSFGVNELDPVGYKLGVYKVWDLVFNPKYDLLLIKSKHQNEAGKKVYKGIDDLGEEELGTELDTDIDLGTGDETQVEDGDSISSSETINLKLYKFVDRKLTYLNDISFNLGEDDFTVTWSSDGEFFIVLTQKGYWLISSKFGNITTNTYNLSTELNKLYLPIHNLIILNNSHQIIYNYNNQIYKLNLIKSVNQEQLIYNNLQYLILVDNSKLIKFPLLNTFKRILTNMESMEGSILDKQDNIDKNSEGKLLVKLNQFNQLIITYGNNVSISTPIKTGNKYNHILWYNFKNYYMEQFNIINQLSHGNYLILVNRTVKEVNGRDKLIDELIVMNIEDSKYAKGGCVYRFDSDLITHRQKFNYLIKSIDVINESNQLVFIDDHNQLVTLSLLDDYYNESDQLLYKFFIKVDKIINLKSFKIQDTKDREININQFKVVHGPENDIKGFMILLGTGELLLIKNQFNKILMTHYYQLVNLGHNVESIIVNPLLINDEFVNYLLLITGENQLLIYNLMDLVDQSFDNSHHLNDGIKDINISLPLSLTPIKIDITNFEPTKLVVSSNNNGINLIGIEDNLLNNYSTQNEDTDKEEVDTTPLVIKINYQLILNSLIKFDLINGVSFARILDKFGHFYQFNYCLELLLFNGLINNNHTFIKQLIKLIRMVQRPFIFINCLRKIEFKYWSVFFKILDANPIDLMTEFIDNNQMDLGYKFLIIYLNLKTDLLDSNANLNDNDKEIILKIFTLLIDQHKFESAFELCRFIKLLDPGSETLKTLRLSIQTNV